MTWFQREFDKLIDLAVDSMPQNTIMERFARVVARKAAKKFSVGAERLAKRLARRALLDHMFNGMRNPDLWENAITAANREDFEE